MKHWYVVHTRPHKEHQAALNLKRQGYEYYLPQWHCRRRHARRVETVARAFFPRYLFVNLDLELDRWRSINGTVGVSHVVNDGDKPLFVPNKVINDIKDREDDNGLIAPDLSKFTAGQHIEVLEGPMATYTGIFERMPDSERVILLLNILSRQVRATIPRISVSAA